MSAGGVRGVWSRHALLTKQERLLRLEKTTAERRIEFTDEQVRLLERFSPECSSSKQMGLLSVFHKGGSGSSLFDVKPLGFDGSSGGFGWSVF